MRQGNKWLAATLIFTTARRVRLRPTRSRHALATVVHESEYACDLATGGDGAVTVPDDAGAMASPLSARTLRGAIVSVEMTGPPRAVVFQYNPDEVTREISPRQSPGGGGTGAEITRLWGAPTQTINFTLELDAADNVGEGRALAAIGVQARLSALELMLYPSLLHAISSTVMQAVGTIEILPPSAPLIVLTLGPRLTVPVTLTSLTITEQAFGPDLTPIRATVQVSAKVLTYSDLPVAHPGHALYLVHQTASEALALLAPAAAIAEGS